MAEYLQFISENSIYFKLGFALAGTLALYFFWKKKDEIGRHALENTLTTLIVFGFNCVLVTIFFDDIDQVMQAAYAALHVPTLDRAVWDGAPFALICLVAIVTKDFADYWNHRLMHTRWGWPTHAAHHSDTHVNGFTSFRIHFMEAFLMSASYVILLTWLQIPETMPVVVMFWAMHNIYVHLDLDFDHGPLKFLIASPRFHRWHHADVPEAYGKNLANVMPIYDLLFGTYYNPGACGEKMGALNTGVADRDPTSIIAYPFLEWGRMIREAMSRKKTDDAMSPETSPE